MRIDPFWILDCGFWIEQRRPRSQRRRLSRRAAYTLVELLIVIAVLGIAGALLVPNLVNRNSMNVQAAVRRIIGDLSFAQSDALAHQELRQVHFYANGSGYCLVRVATPAAFSESSSVHDYIRYPVVGPGSSGDYIVNFADDDRFVGVTITNVAIEGNGRDINYDTLGGTVNSAGLPGTGGTLTVESGNDRYRIDIAPFTGKLTVRKL